MLLYNMMLLGIIMNGTMDVYKILLFHHVLRKFDPSKVKALLIKFGLYSCYKQLQGRMWKYLYGSQGSLNQQC